MHKEEATCNDGFSIFFFHVLSAMIETAFKRHIPWHGVHLFLTGKRI